MAFFGFKFLFYGTFSGLYKMGPLIGKELYGRNLKVDGFGGIWN